MTDIHVNALIHVVGFMMLRGVVLYNKSLLFYYTFPRNKKRFYKYSTGALSNMIFM